jgi:hypothetical protein
VRPLVKCSFGGVNRPSHIFGIAFRDDVDHFTTGWIADFVRLAGN